jgi:hypothetical protein
MSWLLERYQPMVFVDEYDIVPRLVKRMLAGRTQCAASA